MIATAGNEMQMATPLVALESSGLVGSVAPPLPGLGLLNLWSPPLQRTQKWAPRGLQDIFAVYTAFGLIDGAPAIVIQVSYGPGVHLDLGRGSESHSHSQPGV